MPDTLLRLRAQSAGDIPVLSSLCQDAITKRQDMTFDQAGKRFVFIANRFCWELELQKRRWFRPRPQPQRTRTAIRFDFVENAQYLGPVQTHDETPLNLLAVTLADDAGGAGHRKIILSFSEGMKIALSCEVIDATLDDLTPPWSVKTRPAHNT